MATITNYSPLEIIDKALFNFDAMGFGYTDFKLSGVIAVSISQPFMYSQYLNGYGNNLTWTPDVAAVYWNPTQVSNINSVLATYSSFASISFSAVVDNTLYSPAGVGLLTNADINISIIYRADLAFAGVSGINNSSYYAGSALDVILNDAKFGSTDYTLGPRTYGGLALMHEIGHSLGLSHPHYDINAVTNARLLTSDFSATTSLGLSQLGFVTNTASSMDKEYFTIMSYDNEIPSNNSNTFAQTPMILDVIALQDAYGPGSGSSGGGNDLITPGSGGIVDSFRTYFDTGGTDTVNLTNYSTGAYLNLGVSIVGASHLVGVSMSISDHTKIIASTNPESLRWFYGEFENATGSIGNDLITGNNLDNTISGGSGDDTLGGGNGNDTMYGGVGNDNFDWDTASRLGNDTMYGGAGNDVYVVDSSSDVVVELSNEGTDTIYASFTYSIATVSNVENLTLFDTGNINATGNSLNNRLDGTSGNNILDGGTGIDTAVYTGTAASHTITIGASSCTIADSTANRDGTDTLINCERLQFSDKNVALDTGRFDHAGSAYMLYQAAYNRTPDVGGLGYWIDRLDKGANLVTDVAAYFVGYAPEFTALYGANPSTHTFVDSLYNNVLHRSSTAGGDTGYQYWEGQLNSGEMTRAFVLESFANSMENVSNVATQIAAGIQYQPYGA